MASEGSNVAASPSLLKVNCKPETCCGEWCTSRQGQASSFSSTTVSHLNSGQDWSDAVPGKIRSFCGGPLPSPKSALSETETHEWLQIPEDCDWRQDTSLPESKPEKSFSNNQEQPNLPCANKLQKGKSEQSNVTDPQSSQSCTADWSDSLTRKWYRDSLPSLPPDTSMLPQVKPEARQNCFNSTNSDAPSISTLNLQQLPHHNGPPSFGVSSCVNRTCPPVASPRWSRPSIRCILPCMTGRSPHATSKKKIKHCSAVSPHLCLPAHMMSLPGVHLQKLQAAGHFTAVIPSPASFRYENTICASCHLYKTCNKVQNVYLCQACKLMRQSGPYLYFVQWYSAWDVGRKDLVSVGFPGYVHALASKKCWCKHQYGTVGMYLLCHDCGLKCGRNEVVFVPENNTHLSANTSRDLVSLDLALSLAADVSRFCTNPYRQDMKEILTMDRLVPDFFDPNFVGNHQNWNQKNTSWFTVSGSDDATHSCPSSSLAHQDIQTCQKMIGDIAESQPDTCNIKSVETEFDRHKHLSPAVISAVVMPCSVQDAHSHKSSSQPQTSLDESQMTSGHLSDSTESSTSPDNIKASSSNAGNRDAACKQLSPQQGPSDMRETPDLSDRIAVNAESNRDGSCPSTVNRDITTIKQSSQDSSCFQDKNVLGVSDTLVTNKIPNARKELCHVEKVQDFAAMCQNPQRASDSADDVLSVMADETFSSLLDSSTTDTELPYRDRPKLEGGRRRRENSCLSQGEMLVCDNGTISQLPNVSICSVGTLGESSNVKTVSEDCRTDTEPRQTGPCTSRNDEWGGAWSGSVGHASGSSEAENCQVDKVGNDGEIHCLPSSKVDVGNDPGLTRAQKYAHKLMPLSRNKTPKFTECDLMTNNDSSLKSISSKDIQTAVPCSSGQSSVTLAKKQDCLEKFTGEHEAISSTCTAHPNSSLLSRESESGYLEDQSNGKTESEKNLSRDRSKKDSEPCSSDVCRTLSTLAGSHSATSNFDLYDAGTEEDSAFEDNCGDAINNDTHLSKSCPCLVKQRNAIQWSGNVNGSADLYTVATEEDTDSSFEVVYVREIWSHHQRNKAEVHANNSSNLSHIKAGGSEMADLEMEKADLKRFYKAERDHGDRNEKNMACIQDYQMEDETSLDTAVDFESTHAEKGTVFAHEKRGDHRELFDKKYEDLKETDVQHKAFVKTDVKVKALEKANDPYSRWHETGGQPKTLQDIDYCNKTLRETESQHQTFQETDGQYKSLQETDGQLENNCSLNLERQRKSESSESISASDAQTSNTDIGPEDVNARSGFQHTHVTLNMMTQDDTPNRQNKFELKKDDTTPHDMELTDRFKLHHTSTDNTNEHGKDDSAVTQSLPLKVYETDAAKLALLRYTEQRENQQKSTDLIITNEQDMESDTGKQELDYGTSLTQTLSEISPHCEKPTENAVYKNESGVQTRAETTCMVRRSSETTEVKATGDVGEMEPSHNIDVERSKSLPASGSKKTSPSDVTTHKRSRQKCGYDMSTEENSDLRERTTKLDNYCTDLHNISTDVMNESQNRDGTFSEILHLHKVNRRNIDSANTSTKKLQILSCSPEWVHTDLNNCRYSSEGGINLTKSNKSDVSSDIEENVVMGPKRISFVDSVSCKVETDAIDNLGFLQSCRRAGVKVSHELLETDCARCHTHACNTSSIHETSLTQQENQEILSPTLVWQDESTDEENDTFITVETLPEECILDMDSSDLEDALHDSNGLAHKLDLNSPIVVTCHVKENSPVFMAQSFKCDKDHIVAAEQFDLADCAKNVIMAMGEQEKIPVDTVKNSSLETRQQVLRNDHRKGTLNSHIGVELDPKFFSDRSDSANSPEKRTGYIHSTDHQEFFRSLLVSKETTAQPEKNMNTPASFRPHSHSLSPHRCHEFVMCKSSRHVTCHGKPSLDQKSLSGASLRFSQKSSFPQESGLGSSAHKLDPQVDIQGQTNLSSVGKPETASERYVVQASPLSTASSKGCYSASSWDKQTLETSLTHWTSELEDSDSAISGSEPSKKKTGFMGFENSVAKSGTSVRGGKMKESVNGSDYPGFNPGLAEGEDQLHSTSSWSWSWPGMAKSAETPTLTEPHARTTSSFTASVSMTYMHSSQHSVQDSAATLLQLPDLKPKSSLANMDYEPACGQADVPESPLPAASAFCFSPNHSSHLPAQKELPKIDTIFPARATKPLQSVSVEQASHGRSFLSHVKMFTSSEDEEMVPHLHDAVTRILDDKSDAIKPLSEEKIKIVTHFTGSKDDPRTAENQHFCDEMKYDTNNLKSEVSGFDLAPSGLQTHPKIPSVLESGYGFGVPDFDILCCSTPKKQFREKKKANKLLSNDLKSNSSSSADTSGKGKPRSKKKQIKKDDIAFNLFPTQKSRFQPRENADPLVCKKFCAVKLIDVKALMSANSVYLSQLKPQVLRKLGIQEELVKSPKSHECKNSDTASQNWKCKTETSDESFGSDLSVMSAPDVKCEGLVGSPARIARIIEVQTNLAQCAQRLKSRNSQPTPLRKSWKPGESSIEAGVTEKSVPKLVLRLDMSADSSTSSLERDKVTNLDDASVGVKDKKRNILSCFRKKSKCQQTAETRKMSVTCNEPSKHHSSRRKHARNEHKNSDPSRKRPHKHRYSSKTQEQASYQIQKFQLAPDRGQQTTHAEVKDVMKKTCVSGSHLNPSKYVGEDKAAFSSYIKFDVNSNTALKMEQSECQEQEKLPHSDRKTGKKLLADAEDSSSSEEIVKIPAKESCEGAEHDNHRASAIGKLSASSHKLVDSSSHEQSCSNAKDYSKKSSLHKNRPNAHHKSSKKVKERDSTHVHSTHVHRAEAPGKKAEHSQKKASLHVSTSERQISETQDKYPSHGDVRRNHGQTSGKKRHKKSQYSTSNSESTRESPSKNSVLGMQDSESSTSKVSKTGDRRKRTRDEELTSDQREDESSVSTHHSCSSRPGRTSEPKYKMLVQSSSDSQITTNDIKSFKIPKKSSSYTGVGKHKEVDEQKPLPGDKNSCSINKDSVKSRPAKAGTTHCTSEGDPPLKGNISETTARKRPVKSVVVSRVASKSSGSDHQHQSPAEDVEMSRTSFQGRRIVVNGDVAKTTSATKPKEGRKVGYLSRFLGIEDSLAATMARMEHLDGDRSLPTVPGSSDRKRQVLRENEDLSPPRKVTLVSALPDTTVSGHPTGDIDTTDMHFALDIQPLRGRDIQQLADDRRNRRAHPYIRPQQRAAAGGKKFATFDLAISDLGELMDCLTTSSFVHTQKQRRPYSSSGTSACRFGQYSFRRSTFSPADSDREIGPEELIHQEDIPDFEMRGRLADMVEELDQATVPQGIEEPPEGSLGIEAEQEEGGDYRVFASEDDKDKLDQDQVSAATAVIRSPSSSEKQSLCELPSAPVCTSDSALPVSTDTVDTEIFTDETYQITDIAEVHGESTWPADMMYQTMDLVGEPDDIGSDLEHLLRTSDSQTSVTMLGKDCIVREDVRDDQRQNVTLLLLEDQSLEPVPGNTKPPQDSRPEVDGLRQTASTPKDQKQNMRLESKELKTDVDTAFQTGKHLEFHHGELNTCDTRTENLESELKPQELSSEDFSTEHKSIHDQMFCSRSTVSQMSPGINMTISSHHLSQGSGQIFCDSKVPECPSKSRDPRLAKSARYRQAQQDCIGYSSYQSAARQVAVGPHTPPDSPPPLGRSDMRQSYQNRSVEVRTDGHLHTGVCVSGHDQGTPQLSECMTDTKQSTHSASSTPFAEFDIDPCQTFLAHSASYKDSSGIASCEDLHPFSSPRKSHNLTLTCPQKPYPWDNNHHGSGYKPPCSGAADCLGSEPFVYQLQPQARRQNHIPGSFCSAVFSTHDHMPIVDKCYPKPAAGAVVPHPLSTYRHPASEKTNTLFTPFPYNSEGHLYSATNDASQSSVHQSLPEKPAGCKSQSDIIKKLMDTVNKIQAQIVPEAKTYGHTAPPSPTCQHRTGPTVMTNSEVCTAEADTTFHTPDSVVPTETLADGDKQSELNPKTRVSSGTALHREQNSQQPCGRQVSSDTHRRQESISNAKRQQRIKTLLKLKEIGALKKEEKGELKHLLVQQERLAREKHGKMKRADANGHQKHGKRVLGLHPLRNDKWDHVPGPIDLSNCDLEHKIDPRLEKCGYTVVEYQTDSSRDPRLNDKLRKDYVEQRKRKTLKRSGKDTPTPGIRIVKDMPWNTVQNLQNLNTGCNIEPGAIHRPVDKSGKSTESGSVDKKQMDERGQAESTSKKNFGHGGAEIKEDKLLQHSDVSEHILSRDIKHSGSSVQSGCSASQVAKADDHEVVQPTTDGRPVVRMERGNIPIVKMERESVEVSRKDRQNNKGFLDNLKRELYADVLEMENLYPESSSAVGERSECAGTAQEVDLLRDSIYCDTSSPPDSDWRPRGESQTLKLQVSDTQGTRKPLWSHHQIVMNTNTVVDDKDSGLTEKNMDCEVYAGTEEFAQFPENDKPCSESELSNFSLFSIAKAEVEKSSHARLTPNTNFTDSDNVVQFKLKDSSPFSHHPQCLEKSCDPPPNPPALSLKRCLLLDKCGPQLGLRQNIRRNKSRSPDSDEDCSVSCVCPKVQSFSSREIFPKSRAASPRGHRPSNVKSMNLDRSRSPNAFHLPSIQSCDRNVSPTSEDRQDKRFFRLKTQYQDEKCRVEAKKRLPDHDNSLHPIGVRIQGITEERCFNPAENEKCNHVRFDTRDDMYQEHQRKLSAFLEDNPTSGHDGHDIRWSPIKEETSRQCSSMKQGCHDGRNNPEYDRHRTDEDMYQEHQRKLSAFLEANPTSSQGHDIRWSPIKEKPSMRYSSRKQRCHDSHHGMRQPERYHRSSSPVCPSGKNFESVNAIKQLSSPQQLVRNRSVSPVSSARGRGFPAYSEVERSVSPLLSAGKRSTSPPNFKKEKCHMDRKSQRSSSPVTDVRTKFSSSRYPTSRKQSPSAKPSWSLTSSLRYDWKRSSTPKSLLTVGSRSPDSSYQIQHKDVLRQKYPGDGSENPTGAKDQVIRQKSPCNYRNLTRPSSPCQGRNFKSVAACPSKQKPSAEPQVRSFITALDDVISSRFRDGDTRHIRDTHKPHASRTDSRARTSDQCWWKANNRSGYIVAHTSSALIQLEQLRSLLVKLGELNSRGFQWTLDIHPKLICEIHDTRHKCGPTSPQLVELEQCLSHISKHQLKGNIRLINHCICRKQSTLALARLVRCSVDRKQTNQSVIVLTSDLGSDEIAGLKELYPEVVFTEICNIDRVLPTLDL